MHKNHVSTNEVLIHYPAQDCWLHFSNPAIVLQTHQIDEVVLILGDVEQGLKRGLYAAGFIAYEASGAFDRALHTKPAGDFPLIWFGLYERVERSATIPFSTPLESDHQDQLSWVASTSRDDYDKAISRIKDYIARGDTYQVNYTYRLRSSFSGDPHMLFGELYRAQKAPYAAFVDTGRFAICSASPELFFSLEREKITSRPMKGTASRGLTLQEDNDQAEWLRNSQKNQAENVMIVDMVRNDIGRIAETGSVNVPDLLVVEKYPTVWQMVSTVTGQTDAGLGDILRALFPPASITGAPKARTMEIIEELETSPRKVYTGGIGFVSPERQAQFNVAIRTAIIDRDDASVEYGVGGGITWDSVDKAEYEECLAKARILSVRIPRFSLLETLRWTPNRGYTLLDLHLHRLQESASYFDFPANFQDVLRCLDELAAGFDEHDHKVRLLVDQDGSVRVESVILSSQEPGQLLKVCLSKEPVDSTDPFLYHKTTNRTVYERARDLCPGFDDVILWNERGEVTESCIANLVVELDGKLYTPPVNCGLLPGTYRSWMLSQGQVEERVIHIDDLQKYTRIYLVNSVRGQMEVEITAF
ncbi:MAG: aminodeoxychorismate synthase component I [Anaerolineales bacterium]|nr:aminodeoxychorismate synthase component I [Anaerolineales bacterium]